MKVLDELDEGSSITVVIHQYDAKKSVIFFVKKNEDQSRKNIKFHIPLSTNISTLCMWLEVHPCVSL